MGKPKDMNRHNKPDAVRLFAQWLASGSSLSDSELEALTELKPEMVAQKLRMLLLAEKHRKLPLVEKQRMQRKLSRVVEEAYGSQMKALLKRRLDDVNPSK